MKNDNSAIQAVDLNAHTLNAQEEQKKTPDLSDPVFKNSQTFDMGLSPIRPKVGRARLNQDYRWSRPMQ